MHLVLEHNFPHCCLHSDPRILNSALVLSRVSRWWRALVLSIPEAWSCIHLFIEHESMTPGEDDEDEDNTYLLDKVAAHIDRSKGLPISLFIKTPNSISYYREDEEGRTKQPFSTAWPKWDTLWRMLLEHRGRWKNLAVYATHRRFFRQLVHTMDRLDFPMLEDLSLLARHLQDHTNTAPLGINAPNLRRLRLNMIDPWPIDASVQTYSGLTELILGGAGIGYWFTKSQYLLPVFKCISRTLVVLVISGLLFSEPTYLENHAREFSLPVLRFTRLG